MTDNDSGSLELIAYRIDNCENGVAGDNSLLNVDINGGYIDGVIIGTNNPRNSKFSDVVSSNLAINGILIIYPTNVASQIISSGVAVINEGLTVGSNVSVKGVATFASIVIGGSLYTDSISLDDNESIKMDVIEVTDSVLSGVTKTLTFTHGKEATNIRGYSCIAANNIIVAGESYLDGNYIYYGVTGVSAITTIFRIVVFYV